MTRPEDALTRAREAAAAERARGGYADDLGGFQIEPADSITEERLLEWALIEPDAEDVYSTRRLGAPITAFKRGLLRALRQYHGQLVSQQTRFNHHAAIYVSQLENRITELEERLGRLEERDSRRGEPPRP